MGRHIPKRSTSCTSCVSASVHTPRHKSFRSEYSARREAWRGNPQHCTVAFPTENREQQPALWPPCSSPHSSRARLFRGSIPWKQFLRFGPLHQGRGTTDAPPPYTPHSSVFSGVWRSFVYCNVSSTSDPPSNVYSAPSRHPVSRALATDAF